MGTTKEMGSIVTNLLVGQDMIFMEGIIIQSETENTLDTIMNVKNYEVLTND
ncbi:TPA: hypothetical protein TVR09_001904 [Streptococcus equi subsp. zooepidemicus]|nr:hypothetical protein [Streptococcus equi subsp. zooepidemicus]